MAEHKDFWFEKIMTAKKKSPETVNFRGQSLSDWEKIRIYLWK